MRFLFSFCLIFTIRSALHSQELFIHLQPGVVGYGGDLSEKTVNIKLLSPGASIGLSLETGNHLAINASWLYGMMRGDDKYSPTRFSRNLKFNSFIREYSLMVQFNLLSRERFDLSPYITAGAALFHFNPYIEFGGQKYYLHNYRTEGQGFYNNVKPYKLTQFSIPFGLGAEWAADENTRIGIVGIFRKTFTDYLDDVSGVYAPKQLLVDNVGFLSPSLAYRGNQLPGGISEYPEAGSPRGNPQNKDIYYFIGVSLKVRFKHSIGAIIESREGNGYDGVRLDCPRF